jgi:predicted dehydrogenase
LECPETSIVGLSNCVYPREAEERRKQFNIPHVFAGYQEMLSTLSLDAVVISTPHKQHFHQVRASLECGLHVLVDKPPACIAEEAEILADLADARSCCFVVASQRRYDPLFLSLRHKVEQNEIGALEFVEIHYGRSKYRDFLSSWRNDPAQSGNGVLLDAGYHLIDNLLWLTDRRVIRSDGCFKTMGARVEVCVFLVLELEGDILVHLSLHLEMPPGMVREEYGFYGSGGGFLLHQSSFPGDNSGMRFIGDHTGERRQDEIKGNHYIDRAPVRNFINAIMGREPVVSSGRKSAETVRTIEYIYRTIESVHAT